MEKFEELKDKMLFDKHINLTSTYFAKGCLDKNDAIINGECVEITTCDNMQFEIMSVYDTLKPNILGHILRSSIYNTCCKENTTHLLR